MADVRLEKVARDFRRIGWLGVVVQVVLAIIPMVTFVWVVFGTAVARRPLTLVDLLVLLGLAILAFTTFWSYRYTRLADRLADAGQRPARKTVVNTLWVGIAAGSLGVALSMLLLIGEVVRVMILVLRTPQAGVPVIQTQTESRAAWVSAIDVVRLLADVATLAGELAIVACTLWLLYRFTQVADDYDRTPAAP
jgi:hypothetical protein